MLRTKNKLHKLFLSMEFTKTVIKYFAYFFLLANVLVAEDFRLLNFYRPEVLK